MPSLPATLPRSDRFNSDYNSRIKTAPITTGVLLKCFACFLREALPICCLRAEEESTKLRDHCFRVDLHGCWLSFIHVSFVSLVGVELRRPLLLRFSFSLIATITTLQWTPFFFCALKRKLTRILKIKKRPNTRRSTDLIRDL